MSTRDEFPDIGHRAQCADFRDAIWTIGKRLLEIPLVKDHTQREETVRAYLYSVAVRSRDLPVDYRGIGSPHNTPFKCLCAELACLVNSYRKYEAEPEHQAINKEDVTDFIDHLEQILLDPTTIRTTELSNARWRLTNDRIANGNKMVED